VGEDCVCGMSCPWAGHMEDCWFTPFMPDVRWQKPAAAEQMLDDAMFWLSRFDLDGLRLDAVPMMPRFAVRHLRDRVRALEGTGVPVYLLGETYTGRGGQPTIRYYLGPAALSGQFDYPVLWALRDALAGRVPMTELDDEVRASEDAWAGSGAVMAPILGNHDVSRFISDVNGDGWANPRTAPPAAPADERPYALLEAAFTFLLTQPGAPIIYYGDEIGLPGAGDPDNRRDMRFGPDVGEREAAVLAHVRRLGRARACSVALRRGARQTLIVNDNLYVFGRDAGEGRTAIVVINRATVPRDFAVAVPADWGMPVDGFVEVVGRAAVVTEERNVMISIPPRSSALLLAETACQGGQR
jgi:glycosidase